METDGTGVLQSGVIEMVSDLGFRSRIEGTEVFEVLGSFVSVNNAPPRTRQQAYVSVTAEESTGIALHNPHKTESATVDLVLVRSFRRTEVKLHWQVGMEKGRNPLIPR